MDLIFLIVGIFLIVTGAKRKDVNGNRTSGGITMLTIGIVITIIGTLIFSTSFIIGYNAASHH